MENLKDILVGISSSIATISIVLGIGRFIGRKEKAIDKLEEAQNKVGSVDIVCNRKFDCPYGDDLAELKSSTQEVKLNVARLEGKLDGVKASVEFIGELIKNGRSGY